MHKIRTWPCGNRVLACFCEGGPPNGRLVAPIPQLVFRIGGLFGAHWVFGPYHGCVELRKKGR